MGIKADQCRGGVYAANAPSREVWFAHHRIMRLVYISTCWVEAITTLWQRTWASGIPVNSVEGGGLYLYVMRLPYPEYMSASPSSRPRENGRRNAVSKQDVELVIRTHCTRLRTTFHSSQGNPNRPCPVLPSMIVPLLTKAVRTWPTLLVHDRRLSALQHTDPTAYDGGVETDAAAPAARVGSWTLSRGNRCVTESSYIGT